MQEQQPAEHSSTIANNTISSSSSSRPRLRDSSLTPPQFIGRQRPPIDLGVALDEVKVGHLDSCSGLTVPYMCASFEFRQLQGYNTRDAVLLEMLYLCAGWSEGQI